MKLHTNGALILVRLGKMSLRHTETMIPRGRVDEITKEPNRFEKGHCRPVTALAPRCKSQAIRTVLTGRELWSAPIGAHQFGPSWYVTLHGLPDILLVGAWFEASPFAGANNRTAMSSVCFKLPLQSQSSDKFHIWGILS